MRSFFLVVQYTSAYINTTSKLGLPSHSPQRNKHGKTAGIRKHRNQKSKNTHKTKPAHRDNKGVGRGCVQSSSCEVRTEFELLFWVGAGRSVRPLRMVDITTPLWTTSSEERSASVCRTTFRKQARFSQSRTSRNLLRRCATTEDLRGSSL